VTSKSASENPPISAKKKGGNRIRKKNPESDQGKAVKADHSGDQIGQPPFLATLAKYWSHRVQAPWQLTISDDAIHSER
jgi:hypothetical protein